MHQQATVETQLRAAQFLAVGHLVGDCGVLAVEHHTGLDAFAEGGKFAGHGFSAGKARRADDGQVLRHTAQCREAELATGQRIDATDDVVQRVRRGRALFDDDYVDRHLDHFQDLEDSVIQRAFFGAGRIEQRLGGEAVDAEWRIAWNQRVGLRRGADQTDDVVTQATHGLGGFSGIDGNAVVLEVQNLSHGYSAFLAAAFFAAMDGEAESAASVFFSSRRPALRNALASTSSNCSCWPMLDQCPPPVGNGTSTV
ncbi:hypothetical protein D3C87_1316830 [compost metagenome]